MTTFTPTQQAILDHALAHTDGRIEWFPEKLKGGARQKVLQALVTRDVIKEVDGVWYVTDVGYALLGARRKATPQGTTGVMADPLVADAELEADVAACEAQWAKGKAQAKPRTRENSKQAEVIRMLQRPEGATINQICENTGWQAHTVRGTFAGAFKKKLGLTITSDKNQGSERVYRIA